MTKFLICPRCKKPCLDPCDNGESALFGSAHILCEPCYHEEDREIDLLGTNDIPERLASYGPSNEQHVGYAAMESLWEEYP